jgi:hypothetical protein
MTFRLSALEVVKPDVLGGQFLQQAVVSKNISLNLPQCFQEGTGRWNWLLSLDTSTKTARTGEGHVQPDPSQGHCFITKEVEGFLVQPVDVPLEMTGETTFRFGQPIPDFTTAIFLTDDESSAIILPLHQVMMEGVISAAGNCIGTWAGDDLAFENNCKPDIDRKTQWTTGATITGFIAVEEADDVWIPEMTQTLCVALSGSAQTYGEDFVDGDREGRRCRRENGRILAREKADWCSASNSACSPPEADSFHLEGTFAASAVKILDACP